MEHRWGNRTPADVEVQIFADPASAGWGRLRDISISGGFIETALRIAVDSTLRMNLPATGCKGVRVLHAIVVRRSTDGVGVEWFDGQLEEITTLVREVSTWQTQEHLSNELRL
jgi:hypothetical protein